MCAFGQNNDLQEKERSTISLGVSIGINDFHQLDKYLSPLIFNGINFASKISFQAKTKDNRHRIDGFFTIGTLNPDIQQREVTLKGGYISYSFVHSLHSWELAGHQLQLSIGPGISSYVMNTDFNTTDETGYITLDQSWYWSHSFNLIFLGNYIFDKNKNISLQFTIPFAELVSRPENGHRLSQTNLDVVDKNFLNASKQGKLEYLWNNFVFFTDLEYHQSINNNFELGLGYRFGWVSSDKPASILFTSMYMNQLFAGIDYLF